jgi:uncharacterized membrane protein YuzA (DUF378 family)
MKAANALGMLLVIVGAINWGLVGLFKFDLVAKIFGEQFGAARYQPSLVVAS